MVLERAHAINFVERSKTPSSEDVVRSSGSSRAIGSGRNPRVDAAKQRDERKLRGKGLTIHLAGRTSDARGRFIADIIRVFRRESTRTLRLAPPQRCASEIDQRTNPTLASRGRQTTGNARRFRARTKRLFNLRYRPRASETLNRPTGSQSKNAYRFVRSNQVYLLVFLRTI